MAHNKTPRVKGALPYPALRTNDFFKIHIWHLPTKEKIAFEGWVTNFSDSYTSQWQEEMVYGRMDPLATYQRTGRSISLGFDIPNDNKAIAMKNMANIRQMIKFMYPLYKQGAMATQNTLQAGPLLALKWTNLISSPSNPDEKLIGYINGGVSYSPEVGEGGFILGELNADGTAAHGASISMKNYFPKKLSLSFTFTVLHTHLVGWAPAAAAPGGATFVFGGNADIDRAFPNAFIGQPEPEPENGGTRTTTNQTTEGTNENLNDRDEPTPEQEEAKKEAREECNNNASDNFANQGQVSGNEENVGAPGICGEDAEGDVGGGVVVNADGDQ